LIAHVAASVRAGAAQVIERLDAVMSLDDHVGDIVFFSTRSVSAMSSGLSSTSRIVLKLFMGFGVQKFNGSPVQRLSGSRFNG